MALVYEKCIRAKEISETGSRLNIVVQKTDETVTLKFEIEYLFE